MSQHHRALHRASTSRPAPGRHRAEPVAGLRVRRTVAGAATGVALAGGLLSVTQAPATALTGQGGNDQQGSSQTSMSKDRLPDTSDAGRVLRIAASKAGSPYSYGATGPGSFDCSGYTHWVFAQLGRDLPRTSAAQAGATRRVSAEDARPGDLVFFTGGGGVYHVGIYAGVVGGHRAVWHSPQPGESVRREAIWTSSVFYGRVG